MYNSTGADLGVFANTGLNEPTYIAIEPAAIPEPSSFILLGITAAVAFCGWRLIL
jgi:hypothetical protein